ncbi:unnamed protein product, partial [Porites evermanni]
VVGKGLEQHLTVNLPSVTIQQLAIEDNLPNSRGTGGSEGTKTDVPQGTLASPFFKIVGKRISFLIGGGCDIKKVRAELIVDHQVRQPDRIAFSFWLVVAHFFNSVSNSAGIAKDYLSLSSVILSGRLQEAELHLPLFSRLSKVLLVHVLKQCLANSGTFMPLLVEQHVSNWWTTAVADGVTSILMTSEEISAVGK